MKSQASPKSIAFVLCTKVHAAMIDLRQLKKRHPDLRVHVNELSVGSILNGYREGDISFDEASGMLSPSVVSPRGESPRRTKIVSSGSGKIQSSKDSCESAPAPVGFMPTWHFQPEKWTVPKDAIYSAIQAIESAIGYMGEVKTDVPNWARQVEIDKRQMENALGALRKLPVEDHGSKG